MKKSKLLLISVMTTVISEESFSMIDNENKSSLPKKQQTLVSLAPKPKKMVVELEKIPEEFQFQTEELKYDASRGMYYYGRSLDESENLNKRVTAQ
ncbi:MAG: hypothetical protein MRY83_18630 [Flavobacteriales bacterium]|nr:hypothetical protein [Flavobacteriales bacterium]